jgi:dTDP-4-dehydrorhamnose reductase
MILVTGASGLLGANFLLAVRQRCKNVAGVVHEHPIHWEHGPILRADLTDPGAAERLIGECKPDWVIHTAAWTDVEQCERDPARARRMNVDMTRYAAHACRKTGARLAYISTDSVFDGTAGGYDETSTPNPLNVYASTKLEGERFALELAGSLVVRTNVYGWNCQPKFSLAEWMLNSLRAGRPFTGFDDVVFSPILANDLAEALLTMMEKNLAGIYHVAGGEACSKHEFGVKLAKAFGLDDGLVRHGTPDSNALPTPRPQKAWLMTRKAAAALGAPLPSVDSGLIRFRNLESSGVASELRWLAQGESTHVPF